MSGVYQHCSEKQHLHRYLAEFDFRYNLRHVSDESRTVEAVRGGEGKRLTYLKLTEPDFRIEAERFLRWRRLNWKAPKPNVIRRWFR
jgi:hypothetical protein